MSELIIVGGSKGKPSGVISKLSYLFNKSKQFERITMFNGIAAPKDLSSADLVLWFPDINNEEPKDYPIKGKGAVLICSKVMRDETTRVDAVTRIFKMHGNAVTMIRRNDLMFEFELVDALNNNWTKTYDISKFVDAILNLYSWTKSSRRKSLEHVPAFNAMWSPEAPEGLEDFISINKELALKVAAGSNNRYFGNYSTRCTRLFPSKKISPTAFAFSPRNVDKRSITSKDLVLTSHEVYYGDRKPSVDAPVQLELYKAHPEINFMIHGHAYIKDCDNNTQEYFPCGDLREVPEILDLLSKGATRINLCNHGFLLVGKDVSDFQRHLDECKFEMI